jgi:hypothetical protein
MIGDAGVAGRGIEFLRAGRLRQLPASACSRPPEPSSRMFIPQMPPEDQNDAAFDAAGLVAQERAGDNAPALSVSELSAQLKRTVEDRFGHVRLRGEISGYKRAASGHVYLSLKDDARIDG